MGSTAQAAASSAQDAYDYVGDRTGVHPNADTVDLVAAPFTMGASLGRMAQRNLIDNPRKKSEDLADQQIAAQKELVNKQKENERVNDLTATRDRQRATARAAARAINTGTVLTSPLGVTNSSAVNNKKLIGS